MKTIVRSLVCAFAALCAFQLSAAEIGTAAEFVAAMNNEPTGSHTLTADIDLTGSGYATVASFSGTLDGAGHKLSGLGAQPLVSSLSGTLRNLTIDGRIGDAPTNFLVEDAGVFCATASAATFEGCVCKGYFVGAKVYNANNHAACFAANATDGTSFTRCMVDSSCQIDNSDNSSFKNNSFRAGFVAYHQSADEGTGVLLSFTDCTNKAPFSVKGDGNASSAAGGFVAKTHAYNSVAASAPEIRFVRCVSETSGAVGRNVPFGCFIGYIDSLGGSTTGGYLARFEGCVNVGSLALSTEAKNQNKGGFIGRAHSCGVIMSDCVSRCDLVDKDANVQMGAFIGQITSPMATKMPIAFTNCANYGEVSGGVCGGFVGKVSTTQYRKVADTPIFYNCANYGEVSGGEFVGTISDCASARIVNSFALSETLVSSVAGTAGWTVDDNVWWNGKTGYRADRTAWTLSQEAILHAGWKTWGVGTSGYPEFGEMKEPEEDKTFTVRFFDMDGSTQLGESQKVKEGYAAEPPDAPQHSGYLFVGWDEDYACITADTDITALYEPVPDGDIETAADFIHDLKLVPDGTFRIKADLDFSEIPNVTIASFSGVLDGEGHTIVGLGQNALFDRLSGAVRNLTVDGTVSGVKTQRSVGGNSVWGVVCVTAVGATVEDVTICGYELKGTGSYSTFAGIAGQAMNAAGCGCVFSRCLVDASCEVTTFANSFAGGIVGKLTREEEFYGACAVFDGCTNAAAFSNPGNYNTSQGVGGICGYVAVNALVQEGVLPSVRFSRCANLGSCTSTGANDIFGGIIGNLCGANMANKGAADTITGSDIVLTDCANCGSYVMTGSTTGFGGGMIGEISNKGNAYITNCVNWADMTALGGGANVCCGGMVGLLDCAALPTRIVNSANYGNLAASSVGGLVGRVDTNPGWDCGNVSWLNCANYGTIVKYDAEYATAGEIVGRIGSGKSSGNRFTVDNCFVSGDTLCASSIVFTVSNVRSTSDAGYEPKKAVKALNSVAEEKGYEAWKLGKLPDGTVVPEIVPFCTKPYKPGFMIIISGSPSATPPPAGVLLPWRTASGSAALTT